MMRAPLAAPSLLVVVLLAGCAELLPSQDTAGLPEYAATATTPAPASAKAVDAAAVDASVARADTLVRAVSPRTGDVRSSGRRLAAEAGGDAVDPGHTTLSGVCGRTLHSDEHRVARHRVRVLPEGATSKSYLGVEVVAYESETWARRALQEWRDAIGACELGKDVDVRGVPVRYYSAVQRRNGRLPVADNAVGTAVTGAEATGVRQLDYRILQRRGAVLSIVLATGEPTPSAADKAEARRLAKVLGTRLAQRHG